MKRQKIWMFVLVALVTLGTVWAWASNPSEAAPEQSSAAPQEDVETTAPFAPPEPLFLHHAQNEEECAQRPIEQQPCDCFHEDDLVPCRCIGELAFCPDACFEGFTIKPCEETHGQCFCAD